MTRILICTLLGSMLACSAAWAGYDASPTQYSLVNWSSEQVQHIYRDGNKAMIDLYMPKSPTQPKELHMRTIVDVAAKRTLTWDLLDPTVPCNSPATVSDWGDPFNYWDQTLQGAPGTPKETGKDKVNGMATTVFEISSPDGGGKLWREDKYGLLVKFMVTQKGAAPVEAFEIKNFKVGKPKASVFKVPSRCKWNK